MIVHFLFHGATPCRMRGVPGSWPPGHIWSPTWQGVTCAACIAAHLTSRFKYWAHGRDRPPEIVTIVRDRGEYLVLRNERGCEIDTSAERFRLHSEQLPPSPRCTCLFPRRQCPRCSQACAACAAARGTPETCKHMTARPLGGLCFPCWQEIAAAAATPPSSPTPTCLVEGGVCDFTGEGDDGLGPCVATCWYERLAPTEPPAPAAGPINDADVAAVTYNLGLVMGVLASIADATPAYLVYLTDLEAGRRVCAPELLGMSASEVRAIVEGLLPLTKVAIRLLRTEVLSGGTTEEKPRPPEN